jgi:hypothetical protein
MARKADEGLAAKWRRRLEEFERAGTPAARFCESEGVSLASFYHWRRRLASSDGAAGAKTPRSRENASLALVE